MKTFVYVVVVLGFVPVQTTVLDSVSVFGVRPDLCLVAAAFIGFIRGPLEGLCMGLALGFVQDFFSAGQIGQNLLMKGGAGLAAGFAGRVVANPTTLTMCLVVLGLSLLSGGVFLLSDRGGVTVADTVHVLGRVVIPQAAYDASLGAGVYWMWNRVAGKRWKGGARFRI